MKKIAIENYKKCNEGWNRYLDMLPAAQNKVLSENIIIAADITKLFDKWNKTKPTAGERIMSVDNIGYMSDEDWTYFQKKVSDQMAEWGWNLSNILENLDRAAKELVMAYEPESRNDTDFRARARRLVAEIYQADLNEKWSREERPR